MGTRRKGNRKKKTVTIEFSYKMISQGRIKNEEMKYHNT